MIKQNSEETLAVFFERLLDQQARQAGAGDMDRRQAQIWCGRWLALRRLRLELSIDDLAKAAQIAPRSIVFVETGLADRSLRQEAGWGQYARLLSTTPQDQVWIEQVLGVAFGCDPVPDERVVARVLDEINAAYLSGALMQMVALG